MGFVAGKLRRLREARAVSAYGADGRSRRALFAAYLRLLVSPVDATVFSVRLRHGALEREFSLRRSDIFTLGEMLFEEQYRTATDLPPRPVIVDGGANIGAAAFWLAGRWPGARIHAFEPEPSNFRLLERNLDGLEGVVLNESALGASEAPVLLHLADNSAEHTIVGGGSGARTIEARCRRLDLYLEEKRIERVDLLKLDVEGAEAMVIEGLGERLKDVGVIVGELHEALVDEAEFYGRLQSAGFEMVSRVRFGSAQDRVHGFEMRRRRG